MRAFENTVLDHSVGAHGTRDRVVIDEHGPAGTIARIIGAMLLPAHLGGSLESTTSRRVFGGELEIVSWSLGVTTLSCPDLVVTKLSFLTTKSIHSQHCAQT